MGLGKAIITVGAIAGAAYGGYYLYKKYVKKEGAQADFDELADANFDYAEDAAAEESFADKIKAAAERQFNKIQ